MKRTKLSDRRLPDYTAGEEIFNMVTHIVGAVVGLVAIVLCVIRSSLEGDAYGIVSGAVFGFSMLLVYTMSSIYHGLAPWRFSKKILQIIDHCSIFILIAGSYTPFSLVLLRKENAVLGWTIFGVIWGCAVLGIVLNSIDLKSFNVISMIIYLGMGWCIVSVWGPVKEGLGQNGTALLLAGGIAYTVGAIFYMIGSKKHYIHAVFHIFTVIGSLLHFLCILLYTL